MAKINHNNYLNTINDLFRDAKKKGISHLVSENNGFTGRDFMLKGEKMINFGTCGYLGLEMDPRLKKRVAEYVNEYGTQFSVSRSYLTSGPNIDLEVLLSKIYNGLPVLVSSSTSSGHISNIPSLVSDTDLVILDQQVHMSVQTAVQLVRVKGTHVEMIRHSNLEMLEDKIKQLMNKYDKIWYMADGVYSMYGDLAPIKDLIALTKKYEKFYLYVDDAHGMSWYGKHGAGYIYETVGLPDKMVLVTTLAKGFGVSGGITIFPNQNLHEKVSLFGGPMTYSHPIAPPLLGAAVASAEIHLSNEIYQLQADLKTRIDYCNSLLAETSLPVISNRITPIFFVGVGQPKVGYNVVKRLMDEGYFINLALFPAVPVKNIGMRFTLTRHITEPDIKGLIDAMAHHFKLALEDEGKTEDNVRRAFYSIHPLNAIQSQVTRLPGQTAEFVVKHETDIANINTEEWDRLIGPNGCYDSQGLKFIQQSFTGNERPEDNWDFHYYMIYDHHKKPIIATFLTVGIFKDDMLSPTGVSLNIESKRKTDPYYLTSKTICMGSLITEGEHLYIDRDNAKWKEALNTLEKELSLLQDLSGASNIMLRDFDTQDAVLQDFFIEEGFVKIEMPNANISENMAWNTNEDYLATLSARNRAHTRNDIFKYEHFFDVEFKDTLTNEETILYRELFLNVVARNYSVNIFPYPLKMFQCMSESPGFEFLVLKLKPEFSPTHESRIVSILGGYKGIDNYTLMPIGLDYDYVFSHGSYRQTLFQALKRARQNGYSKVNFGLSADIEKRKLGAKQHPKSAYMQAKDNFNFELLETISSAAEMA